MKIASRLFGLTILFIILAIPAFSASLSTGFVHVPPGNIELQVSVSLENSENVGGYNILISLGQSIQNYAGCTFSERDDFGEEYNHIEVNADGPGTIRVICSADMINGRRHDPIAPGSGAIFSLHLATAGLPINEFLPIVFIINDLSDNKILDENGLPMGLNSLSSGGMMVSDCEFTCPGDPNMDGIPFGLGDAMLVMSRLSFGQNVWTINPPVQEAAADLNSNGMVDTADMVRFLNILYLF